MIERNIFSRKGFIVGSIIIKFDKNRPLTSGGVGCLCPAQKVPFGTPRCPHYIT